MLKGLVDKLKSLMGGGDSWSYDERRRLNRIRCEIEIEVFHGKFKYQGTVKDMSLTGMYIQCHGILNGGDAVEVRYLAPLLGATEDRVKCRVMWSRPRGNTVVAGVAYDEDETVMAKSWVKVNLKQLGFQPDNIYQRRKAVRADCFLSLDVSLPGKDPRGGTLHNLGTGGALVELDGAELQAGQTVTLHVGPVQKLPRLNAPGVVTTAHHKDGVQHYGVEFAELEPKAQAVLDKYLAALLRVSG